MDEILRFYRVYHSMRYVRRKLVLRLTQTISEEFLAEINQEFSDILNQGEIVQCEALSEERDEADLAELPRLAFNFNRRSLGRLRQLIDCLNAGASDSDREGKAIVSGRKAGRASAAARSPAPVRRLLARTDCRDRHRGPAAREPRSSPSRPAPSTRPQRSNCSTWTRSCARVTSSACASRPITVCPSVKRGHVRQGQQVKEAGRGPAVKLEHAAVRLHPAAR